MNFQNKYLKSHAKIFANLSTVAKFQFLPQQRDVEKRQTLTTMTESQIIKISFALSLIALFLVTRCLMLKTSSEDEAWQKLNGMESHCEIRKSKKKLFQF